MPQNVTPIYDPDTFEYLGWVTKYGYSSFEHAKKEFIGNYKQRKQYELRKNKLLPPFESNYYPTFEMSNWITTSSNVIWKWSEITTAASTAATQIQQLTIAYQRNLTFQINGNLNAIWTTVKAAEVYKPVALTPEQLLAAKRKATIAKARITRAKNKARTLLLMHLDIRQTLDFGAYGYFFVVGSEGNLYQIRTGRSHNVRLFDPIEHKPMWTLCAHPIEAVPDFDTMLAQKLWIENDEPAFVKMANRGTVYANEVAETNIILPQNHHYLALAV